MTSLFSWQTSVIFCPASFCTPRSNFLVILGISWFPTFAFQSPCPFQWKGHLFFSFSFFLFFFFFLVLVLEGVIGFHWTSQLWLSWHWWWGIDLDYWDVEWFTLETNRLFCHFWSPHMSTAFWPLVDCKGYSISSKGFLPIVVDIMVIWIKFSHSVHFSSLFPRCPCSLLPPSA